MEWTAKMSAVCIVAAALLPGMAHGVSPLAASVGMPEKAPLNADEGRRLVAGEFEKNGFLTGALGNDESRLLPFVWGSAATGAYVCFSRAEDEYFDGVSWNVMQVCDGKMSYVERKWTPDTDIWFTPDRLFEICRHDGTSELAYRRELNSEAAAADGGDAISITENEWRTLRIGADGVPSGKTLPGGARTLFADDGIVSIRQIPTLRFRGAKAERPKGRTREEIRLAEATNPRKAWRLSSSQKAEIAARHREYVGKAHPSATVREVYIIACDCNLDGRCDAFVSSDAEELSGGRFRWTCYAEENAGFVRQERIQAVEVDRCETLPVDCEVRAKRNSFFRLDRIGVAPYAMPVVDDGGRAEIWSYARHGGSTRKFRARPGMSKADFYSICGLEERGVAGLEDLFRVHSRLVSAERLRCETVPMER